MRTRIGIIALALVAVAVIGGGAFLVSTGRVVVPNLGGQRTATVESLVLDTTADAYVVTDVSAQEDPQGLRDKNFGNLDFSKIWYANQVQDKEQVVSIGLYKFNLRPLAGKDIQSAHLQLFALRADLAQPARLLDISMAEGAWNEHEVTFNNLPQVSPQPIASSAVYGAGVWYTWDVTGAVVRKARDGEVTFASGLRTVENQREEQAVFASREVGRNIPRLVVTYQPTPSPIPAWGIPAGAALVVVAAVVGILIGRRRNAALAVATARAADSQRLAEGRA